MRLHAAAALAGLHTLGYISSGGAVYGNLTGGPMSEWDPLALESTYGRLKVAAEKTLFELADTGGPSIVVARVGNAYGPGQTTSGNHGLVAAALKSAMTGVTLPIFGDGTMVRDYVHVDDVSWAIASLLMRRPENLLVNVGTGVGTTVLEVVAKVEDVTQRAIRTRFVAAPAGFVHHSVLDISRLRELVPNLTLRSLAHGLASQGANQNNVVRRDRWSSV